MTWLERMKKLYPQIDFIEGFETAKDDDGNFFETITADGVKDEGLSVSSYYKTQERAEDAFHVEFNKRASSCSEIHIRKLPETFKTIVFEPEVWSSGSVDMRRIELYYTYGRFVFC
ncbi:MAG: hypothetical protein OEX12_11540 [Gammaproteobacteria bacterium]|nr:hypothetical protein [Gammaproteobacteria bacterium]